MKYVRVYEGDVKAEYLTTYQEHCERVANIQDYGFDFEGCIVKQADTIEELCDEVVVKYQNDLPIPQRIKNLKECMKLNHITWEEHFGWLFKRFKEKLEWVKLAIYTDKGLIYVAKMNDKGELELL